MPENQSSMTAQKEKRKEQPEQDKQRSQKNNSDWAGAPARPHATWKNGLPRNIRHRRSRNLILSAAPLAVALRIARLMNDNAACRTRLAVRCKNNVSPTNGACAAGNLHNVVRTPRPILAPGG
jgi:hypothetical protein